MDSLSKLPTLDGGVKLRSYQKEMLEASLLRNVIVAMDTGSGKTLVAVARIAAELERTYREGQLIFFLAPSVALADQQSNALRLHLPAYTIRTLTGKDGVDKWTHQALWDATFTNVHVIVCTPAVLLDALSHAFITIERLSLCVFDEAHRAIKGHPMNAIMQRFYHPVKTMQKVPHILGLSASPVINSKKGGLELIERNLDAISITPKHTRTELEKFVHPPEITTVSYLSGPDNSLTDPLCRALAHETQMYDIYTDPYVLELLRTSGERSAKQLAKVTMKQTTFCKDQLRALDLRAVSIAHQLGISAARWYICECILGFKRSLDSNNMMLLDLSEKERSHLHLILDRVLAKGQLHETRTWPDHTSKVSHLVSILKAHSGNHQSVIIFVEQRVHTVALAHLLREISDVNTAYSIGTFVGTSASSRRKASVADIVDVKQQDQDLDAFRSGEKNLMVATNVLEEGIDISACGLVICFDPPQNLVSFVQRRGRARQANSKYFLFVSEDDLKQNSTNWALLESEMKKSYMDSTRQVIDGIEDEDIVNSKTYQVASTGAVLTLESAKSHLYHFCSIGIMQTSKYVDLRPEFDTEYDSEARLWSASVELPSFVHPDVRYAASTDVWKTEAMAIKDAAFHAYVNLHKFNLVNDNLLPLIKNYGPDSSHEHLDQPSLVQVSERLSWQAWDNGQKSLSRHVLTIEQDDMVVVNVSLYIPSSVLLPISITLYWNAKIVYIAKLKPVLDVGHPLDDSQKALLHAATKVILQSIHRNRMASDRHDFVFLISPSLTEPLEDWLPNVQGDRPAAHLLGTDKPLDDLGIIRCNAQRGRAFFIKKFGDLESSKDDTEALILTTPFPKRRDFLHPVTDEGPTAAAYTAMQSLPIEDCTIDNLPSKYSLLAAFIPSITYRIDTTLLIQKLENSLLRSVGFDNTSLLLEAITSPAAAEAADYNRLEYLGDAILKHRTELQVTSQHPSWPESYLTVERDRIVRNSNLAVSALALGLDKFVITKPFTGSRWRPDYLNEIRVVKQGQREMSTKTLADVMEAIIGAAYVDGGFSKAQRCIDVLLPTESWNEPAECLEALIREVRPVSFESRGPLEQLVGHKFKYPTLLMEAITHASYPNIRSGLSYERLEFLGDSVLDLVITPKLFAHPRKLKHWELHRVHEALVNSHFLGYCCMNYAIQEDIFNVVEQASGEHDISRSIRQIHLHDFLRAGHTLILLRQDSVAAFEPLKDAVHTALTTSNEYPWQLLVTLRPHKFFCDMVESVLGAIYIDTHGDLSMCEAFVERLGILEYMRRILAEDVETVSPKERLGAVADQDAVKYVNGREEGANEGSKKTFWCTVSVGEREVVTVKGCRSQEEAEVKAAYKACVLLGDRVGGVTGRKKRKQEAASLYQDAERGEIVADCGADEDDDGGVVLGAD